jgi:hypothetical protein
MRKPEVLYWYWTITGGLMGVGLLGLLTGAGGPFLLGGLAMSLFGAVFCRGRRT